jgi:hypothetical protein
MVAGRLLVLAFALILIVPHTVLGNPILTDCGESYGDGNGEAKSDKDPLYMQMPDSVGLMDTANIVLYVNNPDIQKQVKFIDGFSNAYGEFYTSSGPVQASTSGNFRSVIPYDGSSRVAFGFRNRYNYNDPMTFSFYFIATKPYPEGPALEEYRRNFGNPDSLWYQWSCSDSEDHPVVCNGQKSCKICYKIVGTVARQYMSYVRAAKATPPGGYELTAGKDNDNSQYQSFSYSDQNFQVPSTDSSGKPSTNWCPQSFGVAASPSYARVASDYDTMADSKKKQGATVNKVSGAGLASGPGIEVITIEDKKPCTSSCDNPRTMRFSYELYAEMTPPGSGSMEVKAAKEWCTTPNKLQGEVEKLKAEARAFLSSYRFEGSPTKQFKSKVCYSPATKKNETSGGISGRITDGHNHPMAYMKITLEADGQQYPGYTDEAGNYQFTNVKGLTPDSISPPEATLKAEMSYFRDGKNYFYIIEEEGKGFTIRKKFKVRSEADQRQDIDMKFNAPQNAKSLKVGDTEYTADKPAILWWASNLAPIYYYTGDAVDFSLTILKSNINHKLPFKVYITGDSTYCSPDGYIAIGTADANYASTDRPKNREYHEFSHYLMYSEYGAWPEGFSQAGSKNHAGFINPSSGDSYVEGFAEFMAMVMSEYSNDPDTIKPAYIYASFGSMKRKFTPYQDLGSNEEFMVAGILWDLHDKDGAGLTIQQMWPILKVKHKDFYEYYKAFKAAFPDKADQIDRIFIAHKAFADLNPGNGKRDGFEPYRESAPPANNTRYDVGESYVDYGIKNGNISEIKFDNGEVIGKVTSYGRPDRSQAGMPPKAFIKVPNSAVQFYTVSIHNKNPSDGPDYEYTTEAREGLLFLMPLPDGDEATYMVTPKSQDFTAEKPYTITSSDYLKKYYSAPDGQRYSDTHDFKLKPTGKHLDVPYESLDGRKPKWGTDAGPNVRGPPPTMMPRDSGGLGGVLSNDNAKSICPCMPLLTLLIAGLTSLAARHLL